jgi:hypothetical protein
MHIHKAFIKMFLRNVLKYSDIIFVKNNKSSEYISFLRMFLNTNVPKELFNKKVEIINLKKV